MPVDVQVRRSNIVELKFYFYVLQGYIAVMIKDSAAWCLELNNTRRVLGCRAHGGQPNIVMRYASWGMSEMIHFWGSRRHSPWSFCFTSSLSMCWESLRCIGICCRNPSGSFQSTRSRSIFAAFRHIRYKFIFKLCNCYVNETF